MSSIDKSLRDYYTREIPIRSDKQANIGHKYGLPLRDYNTREIDKNGKSLQLGKLWHL